MPRTIASNDYERDLLANIAKSGWQSTRVVGDEGETVFAYTIGLFHSFGFPELIVFGMPAKTAHGIFDTAARAAASGNPIPLNVPCDKFSDSYKCEFRRVPPYRYDEFVLSARWFYQHEDFPLYQVVWPSVEGYMPWHPKADLTFQESQPIIGVTGYDT